MTKRLSIALLMTTALTISPAFAELNAGVQGDQAVVQDDGLGVVIRFNNDGQLQSVKSTVFHTPEFTDRRGINKAYTIAEEKAKANISRFIGQSSFTSRVVNELDSSSSVTQQNTGSNGANWSKQATRKVGESLSEITGSSAQAFLRGIRILERSYDEKSQEVKVVLGMNQETVSAAQQIKENFGTSGPNATPKTSSRSTANQGDSGNFPSVGSESRKAKDIDKF